MEVTYPHTDQQQQSHFHTHSVTLSTPHITSSPSQVAPAQTCELGGVVAHAYLSSLARVQQAGCLELVRAQRPLRYSTAGRRHVVWQSLSSLSSLSMQKFQSSWLRGFHLFLCVPVVEKVARVLTGVDLSARWNSAAPHVRTHHPLLTLLGAARRASCNIAGHFVKPKDLISLCSCTILPVQSSVCGSVRKRTPRISGSTFC